MKTNDPSKNMSYLIQSGGRYFASVEEVEIALQKIQVEKTKKTMLIIELFIYYIQENTSHTWNTRKKIVSKTEWTPSSPDVNPLESFFWDAIKTKVYAGWEYRHHWVMEMLQLGVEVKQARLQNHVY